jgi:hypothetical protein
MTANGALALAALIVFITKTSELKASNFTPAGAFKGLSAWYREIIAFAFLVVALGVASDVNAGLANAMGVVILLTVALTYLPRLLPKLGLSGSSSSSYPGAGGTAQYGNAGQRQGVYPGSSGPAQYGNAAQRQGRS